MAKKCGAELKNVEWNSPKHPLYMCEENKEKENENYVLSNAMLCFAFVMY